jgi:hypothetical protein
MKKDYNPGDKIFVLENAETLSGKPNRGKILTVKENRENSNYLVTTEPNCSGIWHYQLRLATAEDLICNNYSIF